MEYADNGRPFGSQHTPAQQPAQQQPVQQQQQLLQSVVTVLQQGATAGPPHAMSHYVGSF